MAEESRPSRSFDALVAAAGRLVAEQDVAGISVTELVAAAGVSRPTFYQYFPDVPAAVAAAASAGIAEAFARGDARYGAEPREAFVRGLLGEIVGELSEHRTFYRRVMASPSRTGASELIIRFVVDRMRERLVGEEPAGDAVEDRIAVIAAGVTWLMVGWIGAEPDGRNAPAATAERLSALMLSFTGELVQR